MREGVLRKDEGRGGGLWEGALGGSGRREGRGGCTLCWGIPKRKDVAKFSCIRHGDVRDRFREEEEEEVEGMSKHHHAGSLLDKGWKMSVSGGVLQSLFT